MTSPPCLRRGLRGFFTWQRPVGKHIGTSLTTPVLTLRRSDTEDLSTTCNLSQEAGKCSLKKDQKKVKSLCFSREKISRMTFLLLFTQFGFLYV